jgi:hypothetical protein
MAKDKCQPIRDRIDALEQSIRDLEELLGEVTSSQKPRVRALIRTQKMLLTRAQRELAACERSK